MRCEKVIGSGTSIEKPNPAKGSVGASRQRAESTASRSGSANSLRSTGQVPITSTLSSASPRTHVHFSTSTSPTCCPMCARTPSYSPALRSSLQISVMPLCAMRFASRKPLPTSAIGPCRVMTRIDAPLS